VVRRDPRIALRAGRSQDDGERKISLDDRAASFGGYFFALASAPRPAATAGLAT
jgi:hypothetical protein